MAITLADLPAEFAAVDPDTAQIWIDAAESEVERARWLCAGADPDTGVKLLASHMLKLAGEGTSDATAQAVIVSQSIGGVSVSMKAGTEADSPHGGTTYGRAFDSILKRVLRAPRCHPFRPPRP